MHKVNWKDKWTIYKTNCNQLLNVMQVYQMDTIAKAPKKNLLFDIWYGKRKMSKILSTGNMDHEITN